jgi:hypothetical protein
MSHPGARLDVVTVRRPETPDFSMLLVNRESEAKIGHVRNLEPPRRARVVGRTYAGTTSTLEVEVVATARGWVCVRQVAPGWDGWLAWIPSGDATPLDG